MPLVFAAIVPHPPIIVPGVGRETDFARCQKTVTGMKQLAQLLLGSRPDSLAIISPHAPQDPGSFSINVAPRLTASLAEFEANVPARKFSHDEKLFHKLELAAKESRVPITASAAEKLDHGTSVPLSFIANSLPDLKLLPLSYSWLDSETHFQYGKALGQAIACFAGRVAVLASGDLSHRLNHDSPGGYSPDGEKFDRQVQEIVTAADWKALQQIKPDFAEAAGECGWRSFLILAGLLQGQTTKPEIISYESPFGVGYLVANFKL